MDVVLCSLMLPSVTWLFLFFFSFSCSSLLHVLPPIKPGAVGYLDRKDTHKNTLVSLMGVSFARCYRRRSVLTFRLKIFLISFLSCSVSNYDRVAVNIVSSSGSASSQVWPTFFFWCHLFYWCWGFFSHGLFWSHCWLLVGSLKCLVHLLCLPTASHLGSFDHVSAEAPGSPLKTLTDCHHLPTPPGRLGQGIWLDYHLWVDCCTCLCDYAALWHNQVQFRYNNMTSLPLLILWFFTLMLRHLINCLHGEATQPFISAYLCEINKKAKPTQVFLHTSQLLA